MTSAKLSTLLRSLTTSQALNQLARPPIQIFGVEGRYATALYSAAKKESKLEIVEKELITFQGLLKTDPKLQEFVENPTVKRELKVEALKLLSAKINHSAFVANLLQVMAENSRLKQLNGVVNTFKMFMSAHRGEVVCKVTTAKPLSPEQKERLDAVLKMFIKPDQTIHLTSVVDPSVIGGMVVTIGDQLVDMSVAHKIKKYTNILSRPL